MIMIWKAPKYVLMTINGNNLESTKIVLIHTKNTWQMKLY